MSLLSDRDLLRALAEGEEWQNHCNDIRDALEEAGDPKPDSAAHGMPRFPGAGLVVDPSTISAVEGASIDLCLGGQFRYWPHRDDFYGNRVIDPMAEEAGGVPMFTASLERLGDTFDVHPSQFVLAHTLESIHLGDCLAAQVYGKSSIGRVGLEVENAGYIDPGFHGQITLELKNTTGYTIRLTCGMPIAQMAVHRLSSPAVRPYGHPARASRYQGQTGATPSRYGLGRAPIGQPSLRERLAKLEAERAAQG